MRTSIPRRLCPGVLDDDVAVARRSARVKTRGFEAGIGGTRAGLAPLTEALGVGEGALALDVGLLAQLLDELGVLLSQAPLVEEVGEAVVRVLVADLLVGSLLVDVEEVAAELHLDHFAGRAGGKGFDGTRHPGGEGPGMEPADVSAARIHRGDQGGDLREQLTALELAPADLFAGAAAAGSCLGDQDVRSTVPQRADPVPWS
jgi:hypothetical protein